MVNSNREKHASRDSLDDLYRKRDSALARVVAVWMRDRGEESEELNKALDVLTVAHATATFEFASSSFSS
jgi:predicted RecB family endonuclease